MKITIEILDSLLVAVRQGERDEMAYDPSTDTAQPTGERETYDRPYAWAEVKFDPRTGQVLYLSLRDDEAGDARYFALAASLQGEIGASPAAD